MKLGLDSVRMERIGRSGPSQPQLLPKEAWRNKKEVKIVSGNCSPINYAQDTLYFFYNLERIHALNLEQDLA